MSRDEELMGLMACDDAVLEAMLGTDDARLDPDREVRAKMYMDDLREVLTMEGGAGIRVLRMWLEAAGMSSPVFVANSSIYKFAALRDYAQERMAEIVASDPKSGLRVMLEGARQAAMNKEK